MANEENRPKRTQIMTLKEVAKYLGTHEMTIYRLLNKGKIPGFKLGGQWKFKKDIIDDWIKREIDKQGLSTEDKESKGEEGVMVELIKLEKEGGRFKWKRKSVRATVKK